MPSIIPELKNRFKSEAEPGYREHVAKLFNLNVDGYFGVRVPKIRAIAKEFYDNIKNLPIDQKLDVCDLLLHENIYELKVTAYQWAGKSKRQFERHHINLFEAWLLEWTKDWADCDDICSNVLGEYFLKFPNEAQRVLEWTTSDNLWFRRAAGVSFLKLLRKGSHFELALKIATELLEDEEDLVQKGYGWMLKEASKKWPDEVISFLKTHHSTMSRTAYRYALEKYPKEIKSEMMQL